MAKREAGAAHESDGSEATVGQIRPAAEAATQPRKKRGITGRLVLVALLGAAAWFGGNAGYAWWTCPSSNDLRLFGLWKNGVSGSVCWLI